MPDGAKIGVLNRVKHILSIDGGSLKGALPAAFLAEIEEATGKRIVDHFDLIAGTSTGGIIAIGLGLGVPARTILDFYINEGPAVFRQDRPQLWAVEKLYRAARRLWRAKYAPDRLKSALSSILGDARIGDSKARLLIPAYDSNRRAVHVIKTAHIPGSSATASFRPWMRRSRRPPPRLICPSTRSKMSLD
jgi:patatin-like phospholipase/acyl hydrolase